MITRREVILRKCERIYAIKMDGSVLLRTFIKNVLFY